MSNHAPNRRSRSRFWTWWSPMPTNVTTQTVRGHNECEDIRLSLHTPDDHGVPDHAAGPGGRVGDEHREACPGGMSTPGGRSGVAVWGILDELPYLLSRSPEFPSVLQRIIDVALDGGSAIRLLLCGSALSVIY